MRYAIGKSRLSEMIKQRNGYLSLAAGLLFLCIVLSLLVFHLLSTQRTVVVPPVIERSFWVSETEVSPAYLAEMTTFFTYLRFNITPNNAGNMREILLNYIDPRYYGALKSELIEEDSYIKKNHITTAFFPADVKVDAKHLAVTITGDLKTIIGKESLPAKRTSYLITYAYRHGRLFVKTFTEVNKSA